METKNCIKKHKNKWIKQKKLQTQRFGTNLSDFFNLLTETWVRSVLLDTSSYRDLLTFFTNPSDRHFACSVVMWNVIIILYSNDRTEIDYAAWVTPKEKRNPRVWHLGSGLFLINLITRVVFYIFFVKEPSTKPSLVISKPSPIILYLFINC